MVSLELCSPGLHAAVSRAVSVLDYTLYLFAGYRYLPLRHIHGFQHNTSRDPQTDTAVSVGSLGCMFAWEKCRWKGEHSVASVSALRAHVFAVTVYNVYLVHGHQHLRTPQGRVTQRRWAHAAPSRTAALGAWLWRIARQARL